MAEQRWEYCVDWIDDSVVAANTRMKEWADAGWELVSGGASSFVTSTLGGERIWHTKFVQYWRRPIDT